ncbi:hypothetical protein HYPSUDRAFT_200117 [Hypholoma sublateritium FD-334 SS-4]|uniref:Uncharacterized protein n=1 Tax=Hypholoma sublateritium (strain FD-334 SS-4) TaxID=945553 RepID=A0A0D2MLT5_HYPSF|nr:hypothetical protein HYPSUDRAFT_200117 [Hypholoma sublateritium FD-334 SS-4]
MNITRLHSPTPLDPSAAAERSIASYPQASPTTPKPTRTLPGPHQPTRSQLGRQVEMTHAQFMQLKKTIDQLNGKERRVQNPVGGRKAGRVGCSRAVHPIRHIQTRFKLGPKPPPTTNTLRALAGSRSCSRGAGRHLLTRRRPSERPSAANAPFSAAVVTRGGRPVREQRRGVPSVSSSPSVSALPPSVSDGGGTSKGRGAGASASASVVTTAAGASCSPAPTSLASTPHRPHLHEHPRRHTPQRRAVRRECERLTAGTGTPHATCWEGAS